MSALIIILSIALFLAALKNIRAAGYVGIPVTLGLISTYASASGM